MANIKLILSVFYFIQIEDKNEQFGLCEMSI